MYLHQILFDVHNEQLISLNKHNFRINYIILMYLTLQRQK
jgi:hypothetical protein